MLPFFDLFRGTDVYSTALKLLIAAVCGGLIGIEREYKRRPAGFRTHMLISLGAAMTTLTGQFILVELNQSADPGRLGAQVVAGIGFIGAGSIIVSRRNRVKGLTTAAGLWATAIIGLASGAGFYECGLAATVLILFAELFLSRLEHSLYFRSQNVNLYVEYRGAGYLYQIIEYFKQRNLKMTDMEIIKNTKKSDSESIAIFTVQLNKKHDREDILKEIREFTQTITAEIL